MKLAHILFTIAFFLFASGAHAQNMESPAEKQADALFSAVTQEDAPGVAVLVRGEWAHLV